MTAKIKKRIQVFLSFVMTLAFLVSVPCAEASAAEARAVSEQVQVLDATAFEVAAGEDVPSPLTTFAQCYIGVISSSEGMHIDIITGVVGTASVIGVKDIEIQKKVWYGWKTVAVSSGSEGTNTSGAGCSVLYSDAEKGETYKILCTHYANVDRYEEFRADSGEFVFTY